MSDFNQITGKQIAAARALLGMGQIELARLSGISAPTLRRMEAASAPIPGVSNNVRAVVHKLEDLGIAFIGNTGVDEIVTDGYLDFFGREEDS